MARQVASTLEKALQSAKKEFLVNGYEKASLRTIAKEAGITTGALYIRFPNKNAIFEALVAPVADELLTQFRKAQDMHFDLITAEKTNTSHQVSTEYLFYFVEYIYEHFDVFKLIICCSDGTKYQDFIHDLVELDVRKTIEYFPLLRKLGKIDRIVSPELLHMITSAYFTSVFEIVVHDMEREKAMSYIDQLATFFNCGWDGILRFI